MLWPLVSSPSFLPIITLAFDSWFSKIFWKNYKFLRCYIKIVAEEICLSANVTNRYSMKKVLQKYCKIHRKALESESQKIDSNTVIFLWNFEEHFFYRTFPGDCFWWNKSLLKVRYGIIRQTSDRCLSALNFDTEQIALFCWPVIKLY